MIVKVHHRRAAGYIRGNVRWPRGTHYVDGQALKVLTDAQIKEVESDPAITLEQVKDKDVPAEATVLKTLDLVDPKAAAAPAKGGDKKASGEK